MFDYLTRLQWSLFGSLNMLVLILLTSSVYVTGFYVGGSGQQVLWSIGGLSVGTIYIMGLCRWKVLYPKIRP